MKRKSIKNFVMLVSAVLGILLFTSNVAAKMNTTLTVVESKFHVISSNVLDEKDNLAIVYIPSKDDYAKVTDNISSWDIRKISNISDNLNFPGFTLIPISAEMTAKEIISEICLATQIYSIDKNRIYVAGYKDGADIALKVAMGAPNKIAGYILTEPTILPKDEDIKKLSLQAGWIFTDSSDENYFVSKNLYNKIKMNSTGKVVDGVSVSVKINLTEISSGKDTSEIYLDDNVVSYMLRNPSVFVESHNIGTPNGVAGEVTVDEKIMKYFLRFPRGEGYPEDGKGIKKKMPLIVDLHGSGGESAVDGMIDGTLAGYGMEYLRTSVNCDYFRVYARLPEWGYQAEGHSGKWGSCTAHIQAMIDKIANEYNIDLDRVYLTGFSLGGYGTWQVAIDMPDVFAAIAPCAGDVADLDQLYKIRHVPVHIYHGITDPVVSYTGALMPFYRLKQLGANVLLTTENDGHSLTTVMRSEGAAQWLLQYKRGDVAIKDIVLLTNVKFNKIKNNEDYISGKTLPYTKVIVRHKNKEIAAERADENGNFVIILDDYPKAGDKYELTVVDIYGNEIEPTKMTVLDKKGPAKIKKLKVNLKKGIIKGVTEKMRKYML